MADGSCDIALAVPGLACTLDASGPVDPGSFWLAASFSRDSLILTLILDHADGTCPGTEVDRWQQVVGATSAVIAHDMEPCDGCGCYVEDGAEPREECP